MLSHHCIPLIHDHLQLLLVDLGEQPLADLDSHKRIRAGPLLQRPLCRAPRQTQPRKNLIRLQRHHRTDQDRDPAHRLRQIIQNRSQPLPAALLQQLPGSRAIDIPIAQLHQLPGRRQPLVELVPIELLLVALLDLDRLVPQLLIDRLHRFRPTNLPTLSSNQRAHPVDQVPQIVRQIRIEAPDKPFPGEVPILAPAHLPQQEVAQRVRPEQISSLERTHDHALTLAHLLALEEHKAMRVNLLRQRQSSRHQHCGPDHTVEANDVLADHMAVRRPPLRKGLRVVAETHPRDVIDQRVEPDVSPGLLIERQRNAPGHSSSRDADVLQAPLDDPQNLLAPSLRLDEIRPLHQLQQPVLVLAQGEEVVLLLDPVRLCPVRLALAVDQVILTLERFARDAVEALVQPLEDVPVLVDPRQQSLHRLHMTPIRRANEVVVRDSQRLPRLLERHRHPVTERLRLQPLLRSTLRHILAVLVRAHQEEHLIPAKPPVPRDTVRANLLVRRAQMRQIVDVVDRSSDVELAHRIPRSVG